MKAIDLTPFVWKHPCAYSLIGILARDFPRERHLDCDRAKLLLTFEGEDYSNDEINAMLSASCSLGIAMAIGNDTCFCAITWLSMPVLMQEALRCRTMLQIQDNPLEQSSGLNFRLNASTSRMVMHRLLLRPDCVIRFNLPCDLNDLEISKMTAFLRAQVAPEFDESESNVIGLWPFHKNKDSDEFMDEEDDEVDEEEGMEEPLDTSEEFDSDD